MPTWLAAAGLALLVLAVAFNGSVDMNERRDNWLALFYAGGLGGSVFSLWLAEVLGRAPALRRFFSRLGRESPVILVFHLVGMQVVAAVALFLLGESPERVLRGYWWAVALVAVSFSLGAGAVLKRVPVLRSVFYEPVVAPDRTGPATGAARVPPAA